MVALRKESVDRNSCVRDQTMSKPTSLSARRAWIEIHVRCFSPAGCWVALRKESVDRNRSSLKCAIARIKVALRKESVDRNNVSLSLFANNLKSLSARRAWIEMFLSMGLDGRFKSLSARRAWIEIPGA